MSSPCSKYCKQFLDTTKPNLSIKSRNTFVVHGICYGSVVATTTSNFNSVSVKMIDLYLFWSLSLKNCLITEWVKQVKLHRQTTGSPINIEEFQISDWIFPIDATTSMHASSLTTLMTEHSRGVTQVFFRFGPTMFRLPEAQINPKPQLSPPKVLFDTSLKASYASVTMARQRQSPNPAVADRPFIPLVNERVHFTHHAPLKPDHISRGLNFKGQVPSPVTREEKKTLSC